MYSCLYIYIIYTSRALLARNVRFAKNPWYFNLVYCHSWLVNSKNMNRHIYHLWAQSLSCISFLLLIYLTGHQADQLRTIQSEEWRIFAVNVIDIQCSNYISGTRDSDLFKWTGNYEFIDVDKDHLQIAIKSKWKSIGRLRLTCEVRRPGSSLSPVKAAFDVRLEPLRIVSADKYTPSKSSYILIIAGVSAAMSILCCVLLLVRHIRRTASKLNPQLNMLAEMIAAFNNHAKNSYQLNQQNVDRSSGGTALAPTLPSIQEHSSAALQIGLKPNIDRPLSSNDLNFNDEIYTTKDASNKTAGSLV